MFDYLMVRARARKILLASLLLIVSVVAIDAHAETRVLSLEERVAAQRAIEQVYWSHRVWREENPGPNPDLSAVLSDAMIRDRVEDYLRKSKALEKWWQQPITSGRLQAELDQMAARPGDPRVLSELFAALGNDPYLIAETLTRQTLVDRLIRGLYANDDRFHGVSRRKAEAAMNACRSIACMPSLGGEYRETTWRLRTEKEWLLDQGPDEDVRSLDAAQWQRNLDLLGDKLGGATRLLPAMKSGGLDETAEAFVVTAVLSQGEGEVRIAEVVWPKVPFEVWWAAERGTLDTRDVETSSDFTLPAPRLPASAEGTWSVTPDGHTLEHCQALNDQYLQAVRDAKRCRPGRSPRLVEQCSLSVDNDLICPCTTYVSPSNTKALETMLALRNQWYAESCFMHWQCGAAQCAAPYAAVCTADRFSHPYSHPPLCADQWR